MVNISIDVTDLGGEARPGDKVVFWRPRMGGSATHAGRVISTAPVTVFLTDGKATVSDVEPGEMTVLLQCRGVESQGPVTVGVPDGNHTVTLRALLESQFEYTPPIVSAVQEAASNASASEEAAIRAQVRSEAAADRADAKVDDAINNGANLVRNEVKQDADRAVSARQAATQSESKAKASESAAASSASRAKTSETNAKQSETNAGDYAAVATTAASEAVDAMERATDLAGGDFATHEYVDNELGAKADRADLADGLNAIRQQEIQERDGTAWAHVTESGQRLPLGYAPDGTLDEHARTVWDREVNGVSVSRDDGSYAHVTITKSGHVIHAVHEDGTVEIPGLLDNGRAGYTTTAARDDGIYTHVSTSENGALIWGIRRDGAVEIPGLRAPTSGYEVYERDGEILPANVDTTQLASWGSSSMEFMQEQMRGQASRYGIAFHGHGKGAEDGYQTAARLGSRPALMTATGGVINASSTTELSSSNVNPAAAMLPYTAIIAGVEGLVTPEATRFVFTRTHPGDEVAIEADTPAIPVAGHARRSDMTILNLGKNMVGKRAGAGAEIIELMDEAFAWLAPQKKRALMIGHFANTGTPATGMYRDQINEVNNHLRSRYGRVFVDFEKFVTTNLVFDYLGTTPTQEDIAEQNLGNIPPGASTDGAHLHVAGRDAFARYLFDFMANLGWI